MNNLININNSNGVLTVSSREIAEHFEKRHGDVLETIDKISEQMTSTEFSVNLFIQSIYTDSYNREQKEYLLTRDGFSLLVMGFTGAKALEWKLKYINAFNEMEQAIKQNVSNLSPQLQLLISMELQQKQQAEQIAKVTDKVDRLETVIETFAQPVSKNWCDEMNAKINKMCFNYGLNYQKFKGELYNELEIQAGCNLKTRQTRMRERMDKAGAKYADRMAVNKLHVVDADDKLKLIFEGIVKKYQMRYAG